jgi:predicted PurR-regulated permease PerM
MSINRSSLPARILVYSTFVVILTVGMRELAPILIPIFFSIFAALIFTPHIRWLNSKGVSGGLIVFLVILLFAFIVAVLGVVVAGAAIQFGNQIPIYQTNLVGLIDTLTHYFPQQEDIFLNSTLRSININHDLSYEK